MGVDKNGFEALDKQYLNTIIKNYNGGPVGVDTISVSLSEQIETIEDVIEPYLIQSGFIKRTPKGRVATIKAAGGLLFKLETLLKQNLISN